MAADVTTRSATGPVVRSENGAAKDEGDGWVGVVIYTRRPAPREASSRWNRGRWARDRAAGRNPDRFRPFLSQIQPGRGPSGVCEHGRGLGDSSGEWCHVVGGDWQDGHPIDLDPNILCLGPRRLQWPPAFSLSFRFLLIIIKGVHFSCRPIAGVLSRCLA
jgi:hypothetical protein